jgi:hypothetical protein
MIRRPPCPLKTTATARESIMLRNFAIGSTKEKARIRTLPRIRREDGADGLSHAASIACFAEK